MVGQVKIICGDPIAIFAFFLFAIIFTIFSSHHHHSNRYSASSLRRVVGYIFISTIITTLIYNRKMLAEVVDVAHIFDLQNAFIPSLVTVLFINIFMMLTIEVVLHLRASRRVIDEVTDKNDMTQYQYSRLKEQLNPHFLFNSLNVLDYLVTSGEQVRASAFIAKLANIYRYLLTYEEKRLVPLSHEIEFIEQYVDLLRERFGEALIVNITVDVRGGERYIVPYGLLLVVENCVKHNVVSADRPLTINIESQAETIVIRNNLQKKISSVHGSLGIGLKNLDLRYRSVADATIDYYSTEDEFVVRLPLLV